MNSRSLMTGVAAGLVLLLSTLVGAAAPALAQEAPRTEMGSRDALTLPTGRLRLAWTVNRDARFFIDLDRTTRKGAIVELWVFEVLAIDERSSDPVKLEHSVARVRMNCEARTVQELRVTVYDQHSRVVGSLPTQAEGPFTRFHQEVARSVCDGEAATGREFMGHAAALTWARADLRGSV